MSHDDRKIQQFRDTAFTDDKTARKYLKKNRWNLEQALDDYYNTAGDEGRGPSQQTLAARAQLFLQLADPEGKNPLTCSYMDEEGVQRLCDAIGIDPVDPSILVFCYLCGASSMGTFTKKEFMEGLAAINVSTLAELKEKSTEWPTTLQTPDLARPVYRFVYKYALEANHKSLSTETAREYWELLLPPLNFELCESWLKYVDEVLLKRENGQISRDVWNVVFDFLKLTHESDVAEFDPVASAWPTVIDDFVEWHRSRVQSSR